MVRGVILKIRNRDSVTAVDIVNTHYKKSKEHGRVFYSTDVPISTNREIEQVLFYFIHQGRTRFVLADVEHLETSREAFIADNAALYSPVEYASTEKVSWLLIKNMKEVSSDYIDSCKVYYTNGAIKCLSDVISQPRINRVYYSVQEENDEDILIR